MEPLFFGTPQQRLYGVHHAPAGKGRRSAVLLCYPAVYEYMRSHWAFRKLAAMLSREGFHVLRFDYAGTGDSAGDYVDSNVGLWRANIEEAAAELQDLAEVGEISIVGLRLGATLAALATADGLAVRDLVLWDPAVDGESHIRDLRRIERLKYGMLRQGPRVKPHELLGYPLTGKTAADIRRVTLSQVRTCSAQRVLIFASESRPEYRELAQHLQDRSGKSAEVCVIPGEASMGVEEVLLATRVLQAVTTALAGGST